ncbi:hypothetical protein BKA62DRAFT_719451 [Auriculariales sp. MPI-PUGE-AT-0066]|nr:hypothetical protein BKA62DRAFT_719451 [Auriculariales sp. MPI-PUGE-AT-0066]
MRPPVARRPTPWQRLVSIAISTLTICCSPPGGHASRPAGRPCSVRDIRCGPVPSLTPDVQIAGTFGHTLVLFTCPP